ncbi:MAG: hypothetical protein RMK84_03750 [Oscillochloridaceae bacterium]|nr:hypothetical protein [Chloroflexaceae bacterium]MDW8389220.1 hypothetical protein [Oscillochloridaceae bacterium]
MNPSLAQMASSPTTLRRRLVLSLLVAGALGQLFNNIALVRISESFAITVPLLILGAAAALAFFTPVPRPADDTPVILAVVLIGWQIFVGLVLGLTTNREWIQPFGLLLIYALCFASAARLMITADDIGWAVATAAVMIIMFGSFGIIQFVLLNFFGVVLALPEAFSAVVWNPLIDIYRTGGVLRPAGLSYEPSTFSIALSFALVLLMMLTSVYSFKNRKLLLVSVLVLLTASLLTLSLSGWAIAVPALAVSVLNARFRRFAIPLIIIVTAVVIWALYAGVAPVVTDRLNTIAAGEDESANVRVLAALTLLVHPPQDLPHFFTGTGLGQNPDFAAVMDEVYLRRFGITEPFIHNIFTVVRVTQGWVGIALHLILLFAVLRPDVRRNREFYLPMFVMVFALHFASGFYLDPTFWSILALLMVLRRLDARHPETTPALQPNIRSLPTRARATAEHAARIGGNG